MKFFRRTKNNISPFDHEKNFIQQDDEGDVLIYKNKIFDNKIKPSMYIYFFNKNRKPNKYWFVNDQLHREDGPAIEHANGNKDWFLNGTDYGRNEDFTNESWKKFVKLIIFA